MKRVPIVTDADMEALAKLLQARYPIESQAGLVLFNTLHAAMHCDDNVTISLATGTLTTTPHTGPGRAELWIVDDEPWS